jgi:uncharacterized protein (TIGR02594 family)
MDQPAWLAAAWAEFGVREAPGSANTPAVLNYFREAGHGEISGDDVAWCAAFAGAMLKRGGFEPTGSLLARSYLSWGEPLDVPRPGAVTVLSRGEDPGAGHVGFLIGDADGKVYVLGGNQSNAVTVEAFAAARVLGYRWPPAAKESGAQPSDIFQIALAHVLEMEGGFSDDPYDPGGPTNRGITLEDYARWISVTIDAANRSALVEDLKRIPDAAVEDIYRNRYWTPAACPELPPPVALMHFDAAVNHGLGGAKRMLQAIAGVTVDGEIGPLTLAAIAMSSPLDLVARYASLRRERYRALPMFWRFGTGWLKRVDATEKRAASLPPARTATPSSETKGPSAMTDNTQTAAKPWTQSKTIWGALITAAAAVIPVLGPVIGVDLSGDVIRQAGDQAISVIQAVTGLFGTLLTIYGRATAKQGIVWSK